MIMSKVKKESHSINGSYEESIKTRIETQGG